MNLNNFKVGDKVVACEADDIIKEHLKLYKDIIYVVTEVDSLFDNFIKVNDRDFYYSDTRFKHYKPLKKKLWRK